MSSSSAAVRASRSRSSACRRARAQTTWADSYGDDQMVLNVGRTWRVGPEPEYLCVWYSAEARTRADRRVGAVFARRRATTAVHAEFECGRPRIDCAGCYTRSYPPATPGSRGRYYLEWFEVATGAPDPTQEHFERRVRAHSDLELNVVALPIGPWRPDPSGSPRGASPTSPPRRALGRRGARGDLAGTGRRRLR